MSTTRPAAVDGVRPGDLIVAVDGQPVETMAELQRLAVGERIGVSVTFTVARHENLLGNVVVPHELAARAPTTDFQDSTRL